MYSIIALWEFKKRKKQNVTKNNYNKIKKNTDMNILGITANKTNINQIRNFEIRNPCIKQSTDILIQVEGMNERTNWKE